MDKHRKHSTKSGSKKTTADLNKDLNRECYIKARALTAALKSRYWQGLSKDTNIVGAAFGRRIAHDEITDEPALIVYVARKVPFQFLPPSRLLPKRMYVGGDSIAVDVIETGPFYPLAFTARERPAPLGISIGNVNEASAGTFGALVVDNTDSTDCILTNNHVIARENLATLGEMVCQPGVFDGGMPGVDDIAALKRFVMINAAGNTVDGAIAEVLPGMTINEVHDKIIDVASADHPAIGLLFAGGCNRTIMNPIADVLAQLNVSFRADNATATVEIGDNVEKVGRTTEYTTSTVTEIDATVTINYNFGAATFDNQITTAWMSDRGDSGSLVYRGGAGGNVSKCDSCGSSQAASDLLSVNLDREQDMAKMVRDQFLRHTRIGRFAIDLFYANEERALMRLAQTKINEEDKDYARKIYDKYREEAYSAFCEGEKSDRIITEQHFKEAESAFSRAKKYLAHDETKAAERLFALARQYSIGKNARQLLAMLNDEKIAKELSDIIREVKFIKQDPGTCGSCR